MLLQTEETDRHGYTTHQMKNLVQRLIRGFFWFRVNGWAIAFTLFLGTSSLHAQPPTDWLLPNTGSWFLSTNWSNGVPTSTSVAVVANGGTAQIGTVEGSAIAQVGDLTIGSLTGLGGTVSISTGGSLEVFQSLTVEANGTLISTFGPAVLVHNGGTVLNSGIISGATNGVEMDAGGTLTNNLNATISGSLSATSTFTFAAVMVSGGAGNITNSGKISGECGIVLNSGGLIINNAGGTIQGHALNKNGFNSNTGSAILLVCGGSVMNSAGGTIEGIGLDSWGIKSLSGVVNISNFGAISGNIDGVNVNGGGMLVNGTGASVIAKMESAIAVTLGGTETIVNSGMISSALAAISVQNTASAFITNNAGGVITGTNGISIDTTLSSGVATLLNAGTINGSVDLGNAPNKVTLLSGGRINGDLNLGSNSGSQLILDGLGEQAISQAVTGSITNPGFLIKQGAGIWTIDENLSAPVSTDVIAGTLNVAQNATLMSPLLTIESGGALTGSGIVSGNVINSGLVSPGNSPGTITILGNYTQNPNGILRIEVAGLAPGDFDLLAVRGHASLAGALQLISLNGFKLQVGDKLTFLTANSVSGSFSTILNPFPSNTIIQAQVILLPNAVELVGTQGSFAQFANTPNSVAVALALDSAVGDQRASALINFLDNEPLNKLNSDFTLIAPEALTSVYAIGVSLANVQAANLDRRLADVRAGTRGFNATGFTLNGGTPSFSDGLSGPTGSEGKSGPSVIAPIPENRWGVFATGVGEFTDVGSADGARGFNLRTGGVTLGVDYRIGSNFAIGLTGGYAHTGVDLSDNGNLDVNGGTFGLYATAFGSGFYLDTAATGGLSQYDSHRTALLGTANGSTDGGNFNMLVAGGYDWTNGAFSIGPTASFQYTYVGFNGFTESGSLAPLKFNDQNADSIRTALGIKASYDWKIGGVIIRPELRASWQHEYGDSAYSIVANLANGAGTSFTVHGPKIGRDSLLLGAGFAVLWNDRVSTYVYYDGELARTNYDSQNVSAGVRITF